MAKGSGMSYEISERQLLLPLPEPSLKASLRAGLVSNNPSSTEAPRTAPREAMQLAVSQTSLSKALIYS